MKVRIIGLELEGTPFGQKLVESITLVAETTKEKSVLGTLLDTVADGMLEDTLSTANKALNKKENGNEKDQLEPLQGN